MGKINYLLRKLSYALRGYYYEESKNGYFISNGNRDFGVSFGPTTKKPRED